MYIYLIQLLLLAYCCCQRDIFTLTVGLTTLNQFQPNIAGVAIDWNYKFLFNNTVAQTIFENAILMQDYSNALSISMRPTSGTGYNCDSILQTYCTTNITTAGATLSSNFLYNYTNLIFHVVGVEFDHLNFTQWDAFYSQMMVSGDIFFYGLGSNIDTLTARGLRNATYDMNTYLSEIKQYLNATTIPPQIGNYLLAGPGVNITSKAWVNNITTLITYQNSSQNYVMFTVKMNYFDNDTDCTIANLLSQVYLAQRINDGFYNIETLMQNIMVSISEFKIHSGNGINGVTNSFAAALLALDIMMTWIEMGGSNLNFVLNISSIDYQSPFTSMSNFSNSSDIIFNPVYYALMTYTLFKNGMNTLCLNNVNNNINNINIKNYCMTDGTNYNVLLINKDPNSTVNGTIKINPNSNLNRVTYFYLQANSLLATTNISLSGYSFNGAIGGTPVLVSNSSLMYAQVSSDGYFYIPIAYSQALIMLFTGASATMTDAQWNAATQDTSILELILSLTLISLMMAV